MKGLRNIRALVARAVALEDRIRFLLAENARLKAGIAAGRAEVRTALLERQEVLRKARARARDFLRGQREG